MEQVILVDEFDNSLGVMEKIEAHQKAVLHRAFSIFIFNSNGEMLLQQRALNKYHSAGLWSNACCSHPYPNEQVESAALRRLQQELSFTTPLTKAFHFIYKTNFDNGLTEHEYDHVFIGYYNAPISYNALEINNVKYLTLLEIEKDLAFNPQLYTSWFKIAFPKLKEWINQNTQNANS